jgi:hypothetical protein
MSDSGILDEAYERLHHTGPEFQGQLSNHGPMAVDAMLRLGQGDQVHSWISQYESRLEGPPEARWMILEKEWREFLGDASRLGDWCALFAEQVHTEPWENLLARWWPRLLPGAIASATHGLIRTGHVVRALREHVTAPRLNELAQALGYWAARWQPIPGQQRPDGFRQVGTALDALPSINISGGPRTRIAQLAQTPSWPRSLRALQRPIGAAEVPVALDALVDAAVARYEIWGHSDPIMLVHAATAPRAAALVLPSLPQVLWLDTYDTAWAVAAAISSAYRSTTPLGLHSRAESSAEEIADLAVILGDVHAIKFAEVAQESHRRGNRAALSAALCAIELIAHP